METFGEWVKQNMYIDPNNEEISDVTEAVRIMVNRIVREFNKLSVDTKIHKLVPCGSMVEGTRIWESRIWESFPGKIYDDNPRRVLSMIETYPEIEFDYLAVVDSTRSDGGLVCEEKCEEHVSFVEGVNCSAYQDTHDFVENFKIKVLKAVVSLCNCYTLELFKDADDICFLKTEEVGTCEHCQVEMNTGVLKISDGLTMGYEVLQHYHFEFDWISNRKCLGRPVFDADFNVTVDKVSKMRVLLDLNPVIGEIDGVTVRSRTCTCMKYPETNNREEAYGVARSSRTCACMKYPETTFRGEIDGVATRALTCTCMEYPGTTDREEIKDVATRSRTCTCMKYPGTAIRENLLAFPKNCNQLHGNCWRISSCVFEINTFQNIAVAHKLCFIVLKCIHIFCFFKGIVSTYHLKTAVLHHLNSCSKARTSQCLRKILCFLSQKLKAEKLSKVNTKYNLFDDGGPFRSASYKQQGDMLELLCQSDVWGKDHTYILKFMVCLRLVFSSLPEDNLMLDRYYKCKRKDKLLDRVKLIVTSHETDCDWESVEFECFETFKEHFEPD